MLLAVLMLIPADNENPIDAFIKSKDPPAPRRTLLRRAFLDLTGIPPSIDEQEAFLNDASPGAYERLVDRLLASPRHGERWARLWLDLVRYADSNGYERDAPKPSVWKYRDYVIHALNADKPYDRFVLEQIAGDELPDADAESIIATGFHALGPWQDEVDPLEQPQYRADELDDLVRTTAQTFLGATLGCARCHDHKHDPFTMEDYYSFVAIFEPLKRPNQGRKDRDLPVATPAQLRGGKVDVKKLPRGYFCTEPSPHPPKTHLLHRGKPSARGPEMKPRVPASLVKRPPEFLPPDAYTSRRRLSLARWIASPDNPRTARVIVNRVWQHHFGRGIVATPSDFGSKGAAATHPKLLDWLAHWFTSDAGWSLKRLHRLIMTSRTYRSDRTCRRLDVEAIRDSMLAVGGRLDFRMGGPAVHFHIDAAVIEAHTDKHKAWKNAPDGEASRRTIYGFVKRTLMVPFMEVLDFCDTTRSTARRPVTTVAPQALTLFNGRFANLQAQRFARRLERECGDDADRRIDRAFRIALCRPPTDGERAAVGRFLAEEGLVQTCRVILNLNEFVYVD